MINRRFRLVAILFSLLVMGSCGEKPTEEVTPTPDAKEQDIKQTPTANKKTGKELASKDNTLTNPRGNSGTVPVAGGPESNHTIAPTPDPEEEDDDDDKKKCEEASCGDGKRQGSEACDDGNKINSDECDTHCRKVECGNGSVEGDEECDSDHIACTEDCKLVLCGNGVVDKDEGEDCDPPNATECNFTCKESVCGNGEVELGEQCDDHNTANGDGCNAKCHLASF